MAAKAHKGIVWDEANIAATYHPADKDYGHMKINEPNTPYAQPLQPDEEVPPMSLGGSHEGPMSHGEDAWSSADEESHPQKHDSKFDSKRKDHYNMRKALEDAKRLMAQEDEDEDEKKDAK
eukprot:m.230422 g.230422  ORF g.230422 m.230422 type:complete len:121 (+) comp12061_c0_seq1:180-542(+)